jgi:GMP synthase-like glutamine amidotransferase
VERHFPRTVKEYTLLVVMGGPMNVYEEDVYPFLAQETRIIREALEQDRPMIGFCLGAQLMAKASGVMVSKGPKKEIGWYAVRLTDQGTKDPFLKSFPEEFFVFQWHGDTFHLPDGAVRLVSSEDYLNQAMRIGTNSYGFQFHFEITKDMISEWLEAGQEEFKQIKDRNLPEKILIDADTHIPQAHALAELFFNKYLGNLEAS